jgi:non-canonical (house-cleaning) NTP pyrophosphatase
MMQFGSRIFMILSQASRSSSICTTYSMIGTAVNVVGVAAASGVPEQPVGLDQMSLGAMNRAEEAAKCSGDVSIGIESGIVS